ncbi:MAG: hypothetical protein R3321_15375, partial [Nitrososphaeraceae archaeon]|nr:hypothetical protein [Nitrososphaeraceae archaeon]
MDNNNNKIQVLPIPIQEYQQASERFSVIWNEYVKREEEAKAEVVYMIKVLESNGYSRTKAVAKIISDHKHLKGFSRATIYRELPDSMKRKYQSSDIIMLPEYSDVSNETLDEKKEHGFGFYCWCEDNRGHVIQSIGIRTEDENACHPILGYQYNNDASIFCLLCVIDEYHQGIPLHHKFAPIYSNQEFIDHIISVHPFYNADKTPHEYLEILQNLSLNEEQQKNNMRNTDELGTYLKQNLKRLSLWNEFLRCEVAYQIKGILNLGERMIQQECITFHNYVIGLLKITGSIICYLCMLDNKYTLYSDDNDNKKFIKHIFFEHIDI